MNNIYPFKMWSEIYIFLYRTSFWITSLWLILPPLDFLCRQPATRRQRRFWGIYHQLPASLQRLGIYLWTLCQRRWRSIYRRQENSPNRRRRWGIFRHLATFRRRHPCRRPSAVTANRYSPSTMSVFILRTTTKVGHSDSDVSMIVFSFLFLKIISAKLCKSVFYVFLS